MHEISSSVPSVGIAHPNDNEANFSSNLQVDSERLLEITGVTQMQKHLSSNTNIIYSKGIKAQNTLLGGSEVKRIETYKLPKNTEGKSMDLELVSNIQNIDFYLIQNGSATKDSQYYSNLLKSQSRGQEKTMSNLVLKENHNIEMLAPGKMSKFNSDRQISLNPSN